MKYTVRLCIRNHTSVLEIHKRVKVEPQQAYVGQCSTKSGKSLFNGEMIQRPWRTKLNRKIKGFCAFLHLSHSLLHLKPLITLCFRYGKVAKERRGVTKLAFKRPQLIQEKGAERVKLKLN